MIKKFDHTAITVSDLDKSIEFYRDILGCKIMGMIDNENSKYIYLDAGGAVIELFYFDKKGKPLKESSNEDIGIKHLAFKVDDVDEIVDKLRQENVEIEVEPLETDGVKLAFFKDPDGILLEVIEGEVNLKPYKT
ncbi:MAG: VOC family protein [Halanaerobiaceae bacterium]